MDYQKVASEVLDAIGGKENLEELTHCATRLRFSVNDKSKINEEKLKNNTKILGFVNNNGNYQIIIGPSVQDVYNAIRNTGDLEASGTKNIHTDEAEKKSILDRFLATISAIFTPYIPILATSGIILGLIAIATNFGWLSEESPTYITLNAMGNALLYFFPILLAFTAAKRFGANPFVGATIGAAIMHPSLSGILVSGENVSFLGISYSAMNFANTVIPIIIAMWVFSYTEKFLRTYLPKVLHFMLIPLLSILLMVPLTLMVFGPVGNLFAGWIAALYRFLSDGNLIVFSVVFGVLFIFVIMLGLHWVVLPLQLQILAEQGMEYSLAAGGMGNYALLGIALAVLIFHKDKKMKEVAGSAGFVNLISGITEPTLYGICMKNKRYFLALILGGATGGLVCGVFGIYVKAFAFTGVIGLPAFAAASEVFVYYLIAIFSSITVGFAATYLLDRRQKKESNG
ncbi:PTS system, beta-glucosides-specific IIC component [Evansella caseinilytica]|uniref:PTS system, beta-glucosides-specific IIC component n=1 Tax=Evansella caseinilytica TaxID=1503961 RepID=A0A1H3TV60_9BACI|nr:PTS transporter subunit EIIC [Evansella caseinilytica]SDZ53595.1 PTS system, beta-glucosides-specific IIC component [Evansella caseinilytica]